jgi:hypothetical protein
MTGLAEKCTNLPPPPGAAIHQKKAVVWVADVLHASWIVRYLTQCQGIEFLGAVNFGLGALVAFEAG